VVVEFGNAEC